MSIRTLAAYRIAGTAAIEKPNAASLAKGIEELFEEEPDHEWRDHIEEVAEKNSGRIKQG